MNKTSNQLESVFQEVNEHFCHIPSITVTPGEGSPPNRYTIDYDTIGLCREGNGDINPCERHSISISLPFGFPHFPPNCLPEGSTFHPDFDSSAICIGDVWEGEHSMVKLILHIGEMIQGKVYSKSNAFNEEAAEWYRSNSDQLPFDETDLSVQISEPIPEGASDPDLDGIDTLDDADFEGSFTLESEPLPPPPLDISHLEEFARQKRFQTLATELQALDETFKGRQALEKQTLAAMDNAMDLFQDAESLEEEGKTREALEKYHAIESLVSDYPALKESKQRIQEALDILGELRPAGPHNEAETAAAKGPQATTSQDASDQPSSKRTFYEEKKAVSKKWFHLALGGGSLALLITLILTYFSLASNLDKAKQGFGECQAFLAQNDFSRAERSCEEALELSATVRVVKQRQRKQLTGQIEALLGSPKLLQGLAGKTLIEGQYVSTNTKDMLFAFKEALQNGNTSFIEKQWLQASKNYTKALEIAGNSKSISPSMRAAIQKKLPRAQFNATMQEGEKALAISDWERANNQFGKAKRLAEEHPLILTEDITQIELLSNQSRFNSLRDQALQSFKTGEWANALSSYQQALGLVEKLGLSQSATIATLHQNMARTQIYLSIEKGKEAFAASRWDDVITHYQKAIVLLEENSKLLSKINTTESRAKLSRIMLHAAIIKDKQEVAKSLKAKNYLAAIEQLGAIREGITESPFRDQEEFRAILKELATQIQEAETADLRIEQIAYLTANYKKLFLKHYPAAARSELSLPSVIFLRNLERNLLFRLQCTETGSGRPLRLQMDYLYSPSDKSWSFYSEAIN